MLLAPRRLVEAGVTSFAMTLALTLTGVLSGCGGVYYAVSVQTAASMVEEARVLGAETLAPYEYYYAREHLEKAQFEAAEASYSDAAHYAETAEEYANKAIGIARAAHRAAGAP